jgi:hypothetical protein
MQPPWCRSWRRGGFALVTECRIRRWGEMSAIMTQDASTRAGQGRGWSPILRIAVSLVILIHLAAVVLPPVASPPPASLLANRLIQPFRPYIGLLYLWHGYRFFAPDPGPGHSLRWTLLTETGDLREGTIPDAEKDWPRLLYHRRFMIPEKLAGMIPPVEAPDDIRRGAQLEWGPLVRGVAAELLQRHGGVSVSLEMVEHYLPTPEDELDRRAERPAAVDAWLDRVTPLGTYTLATADVAAASPPSSTVRAGGER